MDYVLLSEGHIEVAVMERKRHASDHYAVTAVVDLPGI